MSLTTGKTPSTLDRLAPPLAASIGFGGASRQHNQQGSRMLRWIMVESARVASVHDPRLKSF
ncbi:MAG: transposase [Nitrososphaerota archaeon]|nr:transposase [Nitrososphaerota archaeon]